VATFKRLTPIGALVTALSLFGCSGSASSSSGTGSEPTGCAAIASEIARQTETDGTCTAVVRLDYQSLKILGHTYVCGNVALMDEAAARDVFSQRVASMPYQLLSGAAASDEWVFTAVAGDFGTALALSARSGLAVFGGDLSYAPFRTATAESGAYGGPFGSASKSDLGEGCPAATAPSMHAFDLRYGAGATVTPPEPEQAVNAVMATALPDGLGHWASLLDAVVLTYGGFEPETPSEWHAEYIVLLNAVAR
jgi:hypothetical protein